MATNEFLVFNEENNNALSQTDYLANAQRVGGITPGLASAELYNKAFRQSSMMAAAIGEVLKNAGVNASDVNFASLASALTSVIDSSSKMLAPVADLAALKAIGTAAMVDSVLIECKTLGLYRFDGGSSLAANDVTVIQPTTGIGRWIRLTRNIENSVQDTILTLYVNTALGNDNNVGTSAGAGAFKTIQAAINSLPKRLDANVTINVAAGTYAEFVTVFGFVGAGRLTLNGDAVVSTSRSVTQIYGNGCDCAVFVIGFNITSTTAAGVAAEGCKFVYFDKCNIVAVAAGQYGAYAVNGAHIYIVDSVISSKTIAAYTKNCSSITIRNCTGVSNSIGLQCEEGCLISIFGTEPAGSTQRVILGGGQIVDSYSPMIRNNSGIFEFNNGGVWTPVGLLTTKPRQANLYQATTVQNTWYTLCSITGKGVLNRVEMNLGGVSNNQFDEIEITVDGVTQVINNTAGHDVNTAGLSDSGSTTRNFFFGFFTETTFFTSLAIRVRHTAAGVTTALHATADYALV